MAALTRYDRAVDLPVPCNCSFVQYTPGMRALSYAPKSLEITELPLARVVPTGRLVELSGRAGCARTTVAVALVRQAQADGEPVAWVQPENGSLYPPDLFESGVDLSALVVVHVPRRERDRGLSNARAVELLLRSGAFGLVVVDLTDEHVHHSLDWQSRLDGLARKHGSRLVLLTQSDDHAPSLGPMVALRIEPRRERCGPGRFLLDHRVLKAKALSSKLAGLRDRHRAPAGLG